MKAIFFILIPISVFAADNQITIDQVGIDNQITISQNGVGHVASVSLGSTSPVDNSIISIDQKDAGNKTATVEIKSGFNNSVDLLQQGTGNHTASILNLSGAANNFSVTQTGSGSHSFTVSSTTGSANNNNSVTATQSGNFGVNKTFSLNLDGSTGASVTIQQTNPLSPDTGSMTINCLPGSCGTYNYIRQ